MTNKQKYDIIDIEKEKRYTEMRKADYTSLDRKVLDMIQRMQNSKNRLINATERVIILKGVAELYPEGADKIKAITDLDTRKYALLCAIGNYDCELRDLIEIENKRGDEINVPIPKFTNSHEIIEFTYRKFFYKD